MSSSIDAAMLPYVWLLHLYVLPCDARTSFLYEYQTGVHSDKEDCHPQLLTDCVWSSTCIIFSSFACSTCRLTVVWYGFKLEGLAWFQACIFLCFRTRDCRTQVGFTWMRSCMSHDFSLSHICGMQVDKKMCRKGSNPFATFNLLCSFCKIQQKIAGKHHWGACISMIRFTSILLNFHRNSTWKI